MKRTHKRELLADPPPGGKIKGVAFLGVVKLLRSRRDDAFALLPPDLHWYLTDTIHPSAWYPESEHVALLRAGAKLYPGSPDRALELMGEFAGRSHCEIYKDVLVGPGSASRTFALWATQHDTGEMRRVRETPNRMRFELIGFGDTSREQCLVITGYFRGTFTVNGFSDVSIEKLACRLWGDQGCVWRCCWTRSPED